MGIYRLFERVYPTGFIPGKPSVSAECGGRDAASYHAKLRTAAAIYKVWKLRKDPKNGKAGKMGGKPMQDTLQLPGPVIMQ